MRLDRDHPDAAVTKIAAAGTCAQYATMYDGGDRRLAVYLHWHILGTSFSIFETFLRPAYPDECLRTREVVVRNSSQTTVQSWSASSPPRDLRDTRTTVVKRVANGGAK